MGSTSVRDKMIEKW